MGNAFFSALLPRFVVEPQSAILKIGSPHQLSCLPHPGNVSVRWIFNGAVLPQGKKGAIEIQGGNLTFLSFNASDEGLYQCMAITGFGSFVSNEAKVEAAGENFVFFVDFSYKTFFFFIFIFLIH